MAGNYLMNWGTSNPLISGMPQQDYGSTLFPTTNGLDMSGGGATSGGNGGWGAGLNQWLNESGVLGSTDANGIRVDWL
jgi:hypothetical protein